MERFFVKSSGQEDVERHRDLLQNINTEANRSESKVNDSAKTVNNTVVIVPRGIPKSGRFWKSERKRASSMIKNKGLRSSLEKKRLLKEEFKRVQQKSREIVEAKKAARQLKRKRRQENLKRRLENERKSEVVQVIKSTSKLRKVKRKHLRMIQKRDTCELIGKR